MTDLKRLRSVTQSFTLSTVLVVLAGLSIHTSQAAAQSAATKSDTAAAKSADGQQEALRSEEKANKARAKAAHEQRKAIRAQDKADQAAKKAGLPPQK